MKALTSGLIVAISMYLTLVAGAEERSIDGFLTGNELLEYCVEENNKCYGYLMGVADTMFLTENMLNSFGRILGPNAKQPLTLICFPTSSSLKSAQLRRVWMKWAEDHPEDLHRNAAALTLVAFEQAWPCK